MRSDMDSFVELELIKKNLFKSAMKGDWYEVQRIYKQHPETHRARITRSGDTALHIAVSDGKEHVVEQLVQLIQEPGGKAVAVEALKIGNERGNTPLHLAASLGNVRLCKCIAATDAELIGKRNQDSETPFFLAALHDLAYQIIHLYGNLVNYVNEKGFSPLHLLAGNPSAFPSGSHISRFEKVIYHCVFVDKLEAQSQTRHHQPRLEALESGDDTNYPENYRTCINFGRLLWKSICIFVDWGKNTISEQSDAGDSEGQRKQQLFPPNYSTCFESIKLLSKIMLIVLGFGSIEIVKIKERKEKHVWAAQIMDELLNRTSVYEYEDNGRNPQPAAPLPKEGGTKPYAVIDGGDVEFNRLAVPSSPPEPDSGEDNKEEISKSINEGENDQLKPEMENRQTPMSIAAKNGAVEILEKILQVISENRKKDPTPEMNKTETPILIAAKNGVAEMVKKILELFPVAIHDMNSEKKNVVLLAVENRQPHVYQLLLDMKIAKDSIFHKVDKDGNSALHLASRLGEHRPWLIPGAALQMQWEIKWYEFVKKSMPVHFFVRFNKQGNTPKEVFTETHKDLAEGGGKWLSKTSNSCSVVAALIATVAFATSSTVPGGVKENIGTPNLENEPAFDMFAISSLIALCLSVTALLMFLSILTSRYQEKDFGTDLPRKLLVGLTSLFVSIASMLVSFCAGHFFVLKDKLKFAALPVYAVTCLPVTFFAVAQFPLYFDLIWAIFRKLPQRSFKVISSEQS